MSPLNFAPYRPGIRPAVFLALAAALLLSATARAEVCNVKVVTDANPDYADIGSMIHSITDNWPATKDKCWAMWYWNHVARRQTAPMELHGHEVTDPIRQFNDYGYTMCSTVAGINCSIWGAMGLDVKFWDVILHTVSEVKYDGKYHLYDNSMSAIYTLCDGKTVAGVEDVGAAGACAASGGRMEPGHIVRYHCLNATSPNGFLAGADCARALSEEQHCFNPNGLKFRYYLNNWDLGHRYILNLREGEVYTRYYHRLDSAAAAKSADKGDGPFQSDPAYYVPNQGKDPEAANPRYGIRGNGVRTWTPPLTTDGLAGNAHAVTGARALAHAGRCAPGSRAARTGRLQDRGGQCHQQHEDQGHAAAGDGERSLRDLREYHQRFTVEGGLEGTGHGADACGNRPARRGQWGL